MRHSTVSVERAVLRLLGINDSYKGKPLANHLVESLPPEKLAQGISVWFGRAMATHRGDPTALALRIAEGKISWDLPKMDMETSRRPIIALARQAVRRLEEIAEKKRQLIQGVHQARPLKYVIVATGNIHDDVVQARAAVLGGADCIAVIRSTAQSLIDHVPHGATTQGFGGTYATQENFRIMRHALDDISKKVGRYIRLVNYSSGLCMPEIAVLGAIEGLDYLLNDSMYGILFRDINMKRTFCDQYFSRLVIARAGIIINTGEDNYLTTAESFRAFPQVLGSHFINEQLAKAAQVREEQMGLGHAFEMDPTIEDSLLYEIAQAEMVREIFPNAPLKYMPPTRHMTGDLFFGHVLDSLFNLVGVMTQQEIQLLGMPTEAIHNPLLQDRAMSLKSANYIFHAARSLSDEISWSPNGKVIRRARSVLEDTHKLLQKVNQVGLMKAISLGYFANMTRDVEGGRGLDGVIRKDQGYWNPLQELLERPLEVHLPTHGDRSAHRAPHHPPHRSQHRSAPRGPQRDASPSQERVEAPQGERRRRRRSRRPRNFRREGNPAVAGPGQEVTAREPAKPPTPDSPEGTS